MGGIARRALPGMLILLVGALPAPAWAQPFPPLESQEPPLVGAPPVAPGFLAPAVEPADPPTPSVSLHVRAPANAAVGQEADYRILIENASRAPAHHVRVRTAVPAAATFVRASPEPTARDPQIIWELDTLPAGSSKEILLTLKPTGGDVDVTARVQFEHGESVRTHVGAGPAAAPPAVPPAPTPPAAPMPPAPPAAAPPTRAVLRLRQTGPTRALVGDFISFQLVVANTGTADARDVELDASLPDGLELWSRTEKAPKGNRGAWKIGRLPPGATVTREYDVLVKQVGDQENVAQATAAGGLRETASWTVRVDEPKLSVAITGPAKGLLNRPVKYQITVTNTGQAPLSHVEVRAELPAGVHLNGAPSGNGRLEGDQVHWLLGDAPPGQQAALTIELTAAQEAEAAVRVTARADRGVTGQAEATTRFEGAAGLRVDIDKDADPVEVGRVVAYTVHVVNRGSAAARKVQLTATIPEQMQPVNEPNGPMVDGQKLTFPEQASLAAGDKTIYTIRLRAVRAGAVKVVVELQSADLTTPLHEEETTTIFGEASPPAVAPPPAPEPPALPPLNPPTIVTPPPADPLVPPPAAPPPPPGPPVPGSG